MDANPDGTERAKPGNCNSQQSGLLNGRLIDLDINFPGLFIVFLVLHVTSILT